MTHVTHIAFTDKINNHAWKETQIHLNKICAADGLEEALRELIRISADRGFILDNLDEVSFTALVREDDTGRALVAQHNKRRMDRAYGAGRKAAPPGRAWKHRGCFLCRANVLGQQRGLEMGYEIKLGELTFIAWPNPFPFHPFHLTVATANHDQQDWSRGVQQLLTEMLELSSAAPHFVVLWNSRDAGASIPSHFHFQVFDRWGSRLLPLEIAAKSVQHGEFTVIDDYPGSVVAARGTMSQLIHTLGPAIQSWLDDHSDSAALNLLATTDPNDTTVSRVYFCPRDRNRSRVPGLNGIVGGLEIAGELIFASPDERLRLDRGEIDYTFAARIIASVQTSSFAEYLT